MDAAQRQPKASRIRIPALAAMLSALAAPGWGGDFTYYVAPPQVGREDHPGTKDKPLTLEAAWRRALTDMAGPGGPHSVVINLMGGRYHLSQALRLERKGDSDRKDTLTLRACTNEAPILVGGFPLPGTRLRPLKDLDAGAWGCLKESAALARIQVVNLDEIDGFPGEALAPGPVHEVFLDGKALTMARYPKAVAPGQVDLDRPSLQVTGTGPAADATGVYTRTELRFTGRPVYQMAKGDATWSLARHQLLPRWELSNYADPLKPGFDRHSWSAFDCLGGPAGRLDEAVQVTPGKWISLEKEKGGTALIATDDPGTAEALGHLLIRKTDGKAKLEGPRNLLRKWPGIRTQSEPVYFNGFPRHPWSQTRSAIEFTEGDETLLTLKSPSDYGAKEGQPFFLENILEALTKPGEFHLDRKAKRLYLIPPDDAKAVGEVILPMTAHLLVMEGAQSVKVEGITFEGGTDTLVTVTKDSRGVSFSRCRFRNGAGYGLRLEGWDHQVDRCEFSGLGRGGVRVAGGDRCKRIASGTRITNCRIHDFGRLHRSFSPGILIDQFVPDENKRDLGLDPVGITLKRNEIFHGPGSGILFRGNDHTIASNHLHNLCQWNNDMGAIYAPGRDLAARGTTIRGNLIRSLGGPLGYYIHGIYLDSCLNNTLVVRNIILDLHDPEAKQPSQREPRTYCGVLHTGGRNVTIRHNLVVGAPFSMRIERRHLDSIAKDAKSGWDLLERFRGMPIDAEGWSKAYKGLEVIPKDWDDAAKLPGWTLPLECEISHNLHFRGNLEAAPGGGGIQLEDSAKEDLLKLMKFEMNTSHPKFPDFKDLAKLDCTFPAGSPVPGLFKLDANARIGIDAAKIGILD